MNRINAVHREAVINKMVDLTHQCWVKDHLKAKTPKDGSISLHLASGNSILPYCEALYGVKVIVTDIESFGIDLSMKNFLKALKTFDIEKAQFSELIRKEYCDATEIPSIFPDIKFDSITLMNMFKSSSIMERLGIRYLSWDTASMIFNNTADNIFRSIFGIANERAEVIFTEDSKRDFNLHDVVKRIAAQKNLDIMEVASKIPSGDSDDGVIIQIHKRS